MAIYAPSRAYGTPDDLRRLVDLAHQLGLAVILDVVYNHFGPDGNYVRAYSDDYFTDGHQTPWGEGINYDGPNNRFVRDLIIDNACQSIAEYHLDGLRLDAKDTIVDDSQTHILAELTQCLRAITNREIIIVAEEARNDVRTMHSVENGGYGVDAVWADDFHHELRVHLTGARENHYADYLGSMQRIARAINEVFIYQGERSEVKGEARGTPVTDEPASSFVLCIQNHDQIGNRPFGERLGHNIDPGRYAVASALRREEQESPLICMGQEFLASTAFLVFADHHDELGQLVTEGRRKEFSGFRAFADDELRASIPDPQAETTFHASKLRLGERKRHAGIYQLYRQLLRLSVEDHVLQLADRASTSAEAIGAQAVVIRRWSESGARVLVANFGAETRLSIRETPGMRDERDGRWVVVLSTSDERFAGSGDVTMVDQTKESVAIPARTAVIFTAG